MTRKSWGPAVIVAVLIINSIISNVFAHVRHIEQQATTMVKFGELNALLEEVAERSDTR